MRITNYELQNYFEVSQPTATKLKKEILKTVNKTGNIITVADLARYEGLTVNETLELLNRNKSKN